jgi:sec-independent protein translocase protein TatA
MFGTLGGPEILLILVLALIVFGPRKLPEIGKSMGRMLAEFRKASNDFKRTIEDEVEAEKSPPAAPPASLPPPGTATPPPAESLPPAGEAAAPSLPVAEPTPPTVSRQEPPPAESK